MELLGPQHALEPGYSALAAMHVSAMIVTDDIEKLVQLCSELVGRMDFGLDIEKQREKKGD